MKREFDRVVLRRVWWDGPEPVPGDALRTRTGRRYLILRVRGKRLHCIVDSKEEADFGGRVFDWQWNRRTWRKDVRKEAHPKQKGGIALSRVRVARAEPAAALPPAPKD